MKDNLIRDKRHFLKSLLYTLIIFFLGWFVGVLSIMYETVGVKEGIGR
jgi:hypothetical protein